MPNIQSSLQPQFGGFRKPGKVKNGQLIITKHVKGDVVYQGDIVVRGGHVDGDVISQAGSIRYERGSNSSKHCLDAPGPVVKGKTQAKKNVTVDAYCQVEDIYAGQNVELLPHFVYDWRTRTHANNVRAGGDVTVGAGAQLNNIQAENDVHLRGGRCANIKAGNRVDLDAESQAQNIQAGDQVSLHGYSFESGASAQNIETPADVFLGPYTKVNHIQAGGKVRIDAHNYAKVDNINGKPYQPETKDTHDQRVELLKPVHDVWSRNGDR